GKKIGRQASEADIQQAVHAAARNLAKMFPFMDLVILYDNSTLKEPCQWKIVECLQGKCVVNLEWVLNRAICSLFGICVSLVATSPADVGTEKKGILFSARDLTSAIREHKTLSLDVKTSNP